MYVSEMGCSPKISTIIQKTMCSIQEPSVRSSCSNQNRPMSVRQVSRAQVYRPDHKYECHQKLNGQILEVTRVTWSDYG